jgi:hypothetical protein
VTEPAGEQNTQGNSARRSQRSSAELPASLIRACLFRMTTGITDALTRRELDERTAFADRATSEGVRVIGPCRVHAEDFVIAELHILVETMRTALEPGNSSD